MRAVLVLLAMIAMPCSAGQVYKCKGPKGEVTFTNIKCPENASTQKYGTFQPEADNPRQYRDAVADHNAREEAAQQQSMTSSYATPTVQASNTPDNSKRDAEYRETRKRWGARMAGPPPDGYTKAPPTAAPIVSALKPAATQTCKQNGGGSVTCFGSDGTIANGHVNENGSGTMFNSNGAIQQIHSMPKRDGACVPDVNGFCN